MIADNNRLPKPRKYSPVKREVAMELWKSTYIVMVGKTPDNILHKTAISQANSAVDAFFEKFNENK